MQSLQFIFILMVCSSQMYGPHGQDVTANTTGPVCIPGQKTEYMVKFSDDRQFQIINTTVVEDEEIGNIYKYAICSMTTEGKTAADYEFHLVDCYQGDDNDIKTSVTTSEVQAEMCSLHPLASGLTNDTTTEEAADVLATNDTNLGANETVVPTLHLQILDQNGYVLEHTKGDKMMRLRVLSNHAEAYGSPVVNQCYFKLTDIWENGTEKVDPAEEESEEEMEDEGYEMFLKYGCSMRTSKLFMERSEFVSNGDSEILLTKPFNLSSVINVKNDIGFYNLTIGCLVKLCLAENVCKSGCPGTKAEYKMVKKDTLSYELGAMVTVKPLSPGERVKIHINRGSNRPPHVECVFHEKQSFLGAYEAYLALASLIVVCLILVLVMYLAAVASCCPSKPEELPEKEASNFYLGHPGKKAAEKPPIKPAYVPPLNNGEVNLLPYYSGQYSGQYTSPKSRRNHEPPPPDNNDWNNRNGGRRRPVTSPRHSDHLSPNHRSPSSQWQHNTNMYLPDREDIGYQGYGRMHEHY